jgi:hypothetical protein
MPLFPHSLQPLMSLLHHQAGCGSAAEGELLDIAAIQLLNVRPRQTQRIFYIIACITGTGVTGTGVTGTGVTTCCLRTISMLGPALVMLD